MTTVLPNTTLYIPDAFWKIPWDSIISERSGESKRLVRVLETMGDTLKPCRNWDATPCAMAWLLLWSRNFGIAQSTLALLECQLVITGGGRLQMLEILQRQAVELLLDLMVIADPKEASIGNINPRQAEEICDRHCAYLAYCAKSESRYFGELTKNYTLAAVPSGMFEHNDSNALRLIDILWGDDDEIEHPPQPKRAERRNFAMGERNRLRRWLEHEDLVRWDHELRRRKIKSFPALVSNDHISVRDRLKKYGLGWFYPIYQRASAVAHGSYIGPFMEELGERGFAPFILGLDDELEREAAHVRRFAHNNAFRLLQLRKTIADFCIAA